LSLTTTIVPRLISASTCSALFFPEPLPGYTLTMNAASVLSSLMSAWTCICCFSSDSIPNRSATAIVREQIAPAPERKTGSPS
jgi:hypothetical protein